MGRRVRTGSAAGSDLQYAPGGVRATFRLALLLFGVTALAACSRPLPEADSPAAKLYAARCGTCHAPHNPGSLTPAMWKVQLDRMDTKYRSVGQAPPAGAEREEILKYLARNAEH